MNVIKALMDGLLKKKILNLINIKTIILKMGPMDLLKISKIIKM
jgi:hypothetical protein